MPESDHSSVELQRLMLSESDMAEAAQQLMQLSGEDTDSSSSMNSNGNNDKKKIKAKMMKSEGLFEQSQCEITSAKIEEIFGKEEISFFLEFGEEIPMTTGFTRKRSSNSPFSQTQTPIFPTSPRRRTASKKPRYRLLESIYMEAKPVKVSLWE